MWRGVRRRVSRSRADATGAIGKWHLGTNAGADPLGQGFDRFFGFHGGCIDNYSHFDYWEEPINFHDLYSDATEIHEDGVYLTDLLTREAVRFVDANQTQPFLLYVAYNLPHYPMQAPQALVESFFHLPPYRATYAAMVAAVDASVDQVVDRIDQLGLTRDTLVIFPSDHGASAEGRANGAVGDNGPYRGHKFSLFDGGLRVPGLVRWPARIPAGQIRDQVACTFDLAPTILHAAGGNLETINPPFEGIDLIPALTANAPLPDRPLCWKNGPQEAVRVGHWKLVRHARDDAGKALTAPDDLFLADLDADPSEARNLAADQPDVVARLTAALDQWLRDVAHP